MEQLKQQLRAEGIAYRENEPLAAHCTFKIGGPADVFAQPETEEQLCRTIALCRECGVKYYLLGNGIILIKVLHSCYKVICILASL